MRKYIEVATMSGGLLGITNLISAYQERHSSRDWFSLSRTEKKKRATARWAYYAQIRRETYEEVQASIRLRNTGEESVSEPSASIPETDAKQHQQELQRHRAAKKRYPEDHAETMVCALCQPARKFVYRQAYLKHKSSHARDAICVYCEKVLDSSLIKRHRKFCRARPRDAEWDFGGDDAAAEGREFRPLRSSVEAAMDFESDSDNSGFEILTSRPSHTPPKKKRKSAAKSSRTGTESEYLSSKKKRHSRLDQKAQQIISSLENQAKRLAEILEEAKRVIAIERESAQQNARERELEREERACDREERERIRVERECELNRIEREHRHLKRQPHLVQVGKVLLIDKQQSERRNTTGSGSHCA